MTTPAPDALEQIVIVAAGAALTLVMAGTLLYWIERGWRDLDTRQRGRPPDGSASAHHEDDSAAGPPAPS